MNFLYFVKKLAKELEAYRALFLWAVIASLGTGLIAALQADLLGTLINQIDSAHESKEIYKKIQAYFNIKPHILYPLLFAFTLLMAVPFNFISNLCFEKISYLYTHEIRKRLYRQMLESTVAHYEENSIGSLLSRTDYILNQLQINLIEILRNALQNLLIFLVLLGYLLYLNFKLTALLFLLFPLMMFVIYISTKKFKQMEIAQQKIRADLSQLFSQATIGYKQLKIYSSIPKEMEIFSKKSEKLVKQIIKSIAFFLASSNILHIIYAFFLGILFFAILYPNSIFFENSNTGSLVAFIVAIVGLVRPVKGMSRMSQISQKIMVSFENIELYLSQEKEDLYANADMPVEDIFSIEFKNVCFAYPTEIHAEVLKNISFHINKGEKIAFFGPSGSGKSTILSIILRFYKHLSGSILLNGRNIDHYSLESYRKRLAMVSQEIILFDTTIRENILFSKENVSEERLQHALEVSQCSSFIDQLPKGLNTVIGSEGIDLSGGQKQRISLARGLLKDSSLLLLDEATSSLDNVTDNLIQDYLKTIEKSISLIVVTHKTNKLDMYDRIYFMQSGECIASGTHSELIETNDEYRLLVSNS